MVWVRLDDHFDEHPKIARLDDHALALFVCGLAYCNRNLTDGFIPEQVGQGQLRYCEGDTRPAIHQLERVGMWEKADGGWVVHDFPHYQPSREAVLEDRAKEAARQRERRSTPRSTPRSPERTTPGTTEYVGSGHSPDLAQTTAHPVPVPGDVVSGGLIAQARARAPDAAMKAAARAPVPNGQIEPDPIRLPNGAQQCPLCPDIYTGTYGEHLEQSPRHKIRDQPEDFGRSKRRKKSTPEAQENGDISRELAAIAERKSLTLEDLPQTLRAEHERLQAKERSQANGK